MTICPDCGAHLASHDTCSNTGKTVSLDVPIALIPVLNYAIMVSATTAAMSQARDVSNQMDELRKQIEPLIPPSTQYFDDNNWSTMMLKIMEGAPLTFEIINDGRYWSPSFKVQVSGAKWPKGIFRDDEIMQSEAFDTNEAAEKVLNEILELQDRFAPIETLRCI